MADSSREFQKSKGKSAGFLKGKKNQNSNPKLRGLDKDAEDVRISKTLSWLLRHAAEREGLPMRQDGYVQVDELLKHPKLKGTGLDLEGVKVIVDTDAKKRYDLVFEKSEPREEEPLTDPEQPHLNELAIGSWWIRANQGHSIKAVQLDLKPIESLDDIPSGLALHGTTRDAWSKIEKQGLSKMRRNHIHLAQGMTTDNVISGMRRSSQIFIFIDVPKALEAGMKFALSDNGVVLTEGDESGFLKPEFFSRVEDRSREPIPGWEGSGPIVSKAVKRTEVAAGPSPGSSNRRNGRPGGRKRENPLEGALEDLAISEEVQNQ